MSAPAQIKFVQGANTPVAGRALDGVTGTSVTASNGDNTNIVSWNWSLVDVPPASALAVGSRGTASTMNPFTPDVTGSYLVKLVTVDNLGVSTTDYRAVMIKESATYSRYLPPSFAAALGDTALNIAGQTRGYAPFLEAYLKVIDRLRDVGGSAPSDGQVLKWVAANSRYEPGSSSGSPGGSPSHVQFNDGGVFGGVSGLTWDKTALLLSAAAGRISAGRWEGEAQIDSASSGTLNNFAISHPKTFLVYTNAGAITLNGLTAPSPAVYTPLFIASINNTITPVNEAAGSTAANRIIVPAGSAAAGNHWILWYNPNQSRWIAAAYPAY